MIDFDPSLVVPFFRIRDSLVPLLAATDRVVVPYDPNRVMVYFFASGAGTTNIRPVLAATVQNGFFLANGGEKTFDFATYGALVCQEFHGFATAGATVYAVEVIYTPSGGE
jgi:hypothetical protein